MIHLPLVILVMNGKQHVHVHICVSEREYVTAYVRKPVGATVNQYFFDSRHLIMTVIHRGTNGLPYLCIRQTSYSFSMQERFALTTAPVGPTATTSRVSAVTST